MRRFTPTAVSFLACVLLAALAPAPAAAGVTLQAGVDRAEVAVGDGLTYTITVQSDSGQPGAPTPPDFAGFQVASSGTSTSFNMTNGAMTLSMSTSYQLLAQKEGAFTLGPAKLTAGGTTLESNSVTVQVVSGAPPPAPPPGAPPAQGAPPGPESRVSPDKLFLYADVSRREVLVGEPFSYFSALLSEYDLAECGVESEAEFKGFVVENQETKRQLRPVNFQQKHFPLGSEITKKILIPASQGMFIIQPEVVRVGIKVAGAARRGRGGQWPFGGAEDPFDDPFFNRFFGQNYQVQRQLVRAQPVEIRVLPVPEAGRPAKFSGIIAEDLSISAGLDRKLDKKAVRTAVTESDALNFKVILSGKGDIRNITKPELALGDSFKEYESKATPEVKIDEKGMSGRKTFEFVLVPRKAGQLTIPPVEVNYFDSALRKYRTLKTQPIAVDVQPGEREERLSTAPAGQRKDVAMLGQDLRFISESRDALVGRGPPLYERGWFRALNGLPLGLFVAGWIGAWRRKRLERDPAMARRLAAFRQGREALRAARAAQAGGRAKEALTGLEEAALQCLAGKLGIPASAIVVESIEETLVSGGVRGDLARRARELLLEFQATRYSPAGSDARELEQQIGRTEALLSELEARR